MSINGARLSREHLECGTQGVVQCVAEAVVTGAGSAVESIRLRCYGCT